MVQHILMPIATVAPLPFLAGEEGYRNLFQGNAL